MIKKKLCLIVLAMLQTPAIYADFKEGSPVGPGIIHYHEYRAAGPWHIHVLEIDLSNEWINLETVKAKDLLSGYETTSSMAARSDREKHRVVSATNGDFYGTGGVPVGAQILDGMLLKRPTTRSVFGVTDLKRPIIDIVSFQGAIFTARQTSLAINGINEVRETNKLILYNQYIGLQTGTNFWGTEITADYLTGHRIANDTIYVVATAKDSILGVSGHGNNSIPKNGLVISGHGTASDFLNANVFVGDTLSLFIQLPPTKKSLLELIGGTPRLIRNGVATVEWSNEGTSQTFAYDRHPRTAVGFSQDSTKLYFFTVDGRQPGYSDGMSLFELANYMLEWRVHQGVNLDGGGSTTMVVRGTVVNSPSDASGERLVANALMVISSAPTHQISILRIAPQNAFALAENKIQFSVTGFDQFYNSVKMNVDSLRWLCDPKIGSVNQQGLFTAGKIQDSGYVYVTYGAVRDSALVHVTTVALIKLLPNPVILKIGEKQTINPEARDSFGNLIELARTEYRWSLSGDIGSISNDGIFTATKKGEGFIQADYKSVSGSTSVFVGISSMVILDDFQSTANWTLSGTRINLSECSFAAENSAFVSPPKSGRLLYRLTTGGTSALYLNCSLLISGTPEAIGLQVYGDGKGHWLRGEFQDADKEKFLIDFTEASPGIDWTNSWRYLLVPLKNAIIHWSNPSAVLTFPITWTKIYLAETDEAKKNSGTIYFDDLTAHFIETDVDDQGNILVPDSYLLEQNYPNPFNPKTQIAFGLPKRAHVKLDIFNVRGELISNLLNNLMHPGRHSIDFDASDLSSGVYLYRMDAGEFQTTKKMVVIK